MINESGIIKLSLDRTFVYNYCGQERDPDSSQNFPEGKTKQRKGKLYFHQLRTACKRVLDFGETTALTRQLKAKLRITVETK